MLAYGSEAAVEYDTDHVNDVIALIFFGCCSFFKNIQTIHGDAV